MRLAARTPDGATLRDHLAAAVQAGAPADERLAAQPPAGTEALWGAFVALAAARPVGMSAGAIPPTEIDAWQRLHGVRLSAWEVDTLMAMDRAALAVAQERKP